MRKAGVVAAVVLFLLGIAVLLLPRLVSLDSFRPRIVAALEEKTGRTIGLSGLSLSLFPGIGVKLTQLTVAGDARHPGERLLSVPEAEIRLAIAPLFSGRTEFTKFILRRPEIRFRRYLDGTHSATDIVSRLAKEEKPAAAAPAEKPGEAVAVAVREIRVEEAKLSFRQEEKGGGESAWEISPFTLRLSGIGETQKEIEVRTRIEGMVRGDISFVARVAGGREAGTGRPAASLRGEGTLFGQKVAVEGKIFSSQQPFAVDLAISFPGLELGKIPAMFRDPPERLAKARLEGVVPLSAKVAGTLASTEFTVKADLTRMGATLGEDPELRKVVDAPCTIAATGRYSPDRLLLSNIDLRFPPLSATGNAVLNPGTGGREWAISAKISSLADFGKIPGAAMLSQWSPAGRLAGAGKGRLGRTGEKEKYEIGVDLGEVGFRVPGRRIELRAVDGRVELADGEVRFRPLAGLLNGQRFSLQGEAALGGKPTGEVDFRMAYLDVDALFPPEEAGGKKEGKEPSPQKKGTKAEKDREVAARVTLAIDAGKARGVEFQNLRGKVRYEEGTLFLDSVSARMYGGDVALSGRLGLGAPSPDFRVKVAVKDLAAEEILSRKTTMKDFLSGPVNLSAEIGGGMKDFADFSRTGTGSGSVKITGGKIKGVDLLATAAVLAGLGATAAASPSGLSGKGDTVFSDLSADFRVENGKIKSEALRVLSEKMGLTGSAAIGFDRTIDFRGVLRLSREISDRVRGGAGKFLVGEGGRVEIPLVMTGPLTSPAVSIDPAALAAGAARKVLQGLTGGIPGIETAPGTENAAPGKKPKKEEPFREVEGIFRKILPGK
jgi:AsmA protein